MGERPRPVFPDKHSALAFHFVMVSGTFTSSSLLPDELNENKKRRTVNESPSPSFFWHVPWLILKHDNLETYCGKY